MTHEVFKNRKTLLKMKQASNMIVKNLGATDHNFFSRCVDIISGLLQVKTLIVSGQAYLLEGSLEEILKVLHGEVFEK